MNDSSAAATSDLGHPRLFVPSPQLDPIDRTEDRVTSVSEGKSHDAQSVGQDRPGLPAVASPASPIQMFQSPLLQNEVPQNQRPGVEDRSIQEHRPETLKESRQDMLTNVVDSANSSREMLPELTAHLEKELVQVFKLLSDETRLRILNYLGREGELHVTALCEKLGQSQPAVSHHLALLRVAGLIEARRDGKHNFYSIRSEHVTTLLGEVLGVFGEGRNSLRLGAFTLTQNS